MKEISDYEKHKICTKLIDEFIESIHSNSIDIRDEMFCNVLPFINGLHNLIINIIEAVDSKSHSDSMSSSEFNDMSAKKIMETKEMLSNIDDYMEKTMGINIRKTHPEY